MALFPSLLPSNSWYLFPLTPSPSRATPFSVVISCPSCFRPVLPTHLINPCLARYLGERIKRTTGLVYVRT